MTSPIQPTMNNGLKVQLPEELPSSLKPRSSSASSPTRTTLARTKSQPAMRKKPLSPPTSRLASSPSSSNDTIAKADPSKALQPSSPQAASPTSLTSFKGRKLLSLFAPKKSSTQFCDVNRCSMSPSANVRVISLPSKDQEATQTIVSFFNRKMGTHQPATKVIGAILSEQESVSPTQETKSISAISFKREKIFLDAMKQVFDSLKGNETKISNFYKELIYLIAFEDPRAVLLVCKFFVALSHTEDIKQKFANDLADCFKDKDKLEEMYATMVAVEIQDSNPHAILRGDYFSTFLAGNNLFRPLLNESLEKAYTQLSSCAIKDWPTCAQLANECATSTISHLESHQQIKGYLMEVAKQVRKKVSSFPPKEQNEIIKNILSNLIFLRSICPYFVLKRDIGVKFASYLQSLLQQDKPYSITADDCSSVKHANEVFAKNHSALFSRLDHYFNGIAEASGEGKDPTS